MESKQTFKTYDGVEVSVGDFVYKCWKTGKNRWYDQPSFIRSKRLKIYDFESEDALFFKHKKNATAYVKFMNDDSMPQPTTINSIEDIGKIYGTGHIIMPPTPTPSNITVSMYNQAGEKIISSEVCEFETGVHDGGLKNDMHQPIFEFTNETGKPITIKEGQRIAWKDGRVKLFDAPRKEFKEGKVDLLPNGQMATEPKPDTKPLRSRNANLMIGDDMPDLHYALIQFSHAYNIPINTVLEFIVNQKSK